MKNRRSREAEAGEYVLISVSDTREGMSAETARRAFEPFFTTKQVGKGSGLGLSQVHGFAVQSGGAVTIDSRVGEGTTISLYLPKARGEALSAVSEKAMRHDRSDGETVLLVDDETLVLKSVAATLRNHGYRVLEARNGPEALELLRCGPHIHILITDYARAPGQRARPGREADAAGRQGIIITGYADVRDPGLEEWKGAILRKPFTPAALAERIKEVLREPSASGKLLRLPTVTDRGYRGAGNMG